MARCIIYSRFLDARTLPEFEHVFEFNTIVKIKEEEENDPLETEIGQSIETLGSDGTIGFHADPRLEFNSAIVPEPQPEESRAAPHPKLVIKFRDLWSTQETHNSPVNRKKRSCTEIANEVVDQCGVGPSKRRKQNVKVALKNHSTRSSSTTKSNVSKRNGGKKSGTFILSQKELTSERKEMQDIWNLTRVTHIENNSQILCECCGRSFSSMRNLEAHIRYYTADGIFNCSLCNRKFNRNFQLRRHMRVAHTDQSSRRVYKYKCQICHDQFEKKPGLIAHVTHFHHQRVLLKRRQGTSIRKKNTKSVERHVEKMKSIVPANKVKSSSESESEDEPMSLEKLFVDTNDGDEQFIPASLKIEHEHGICNQIVNEFNEPEPISIKVECDEEDVVENEFDRWQRLMSENATQQSEAHHVNQECLNILSGNHESQLHGNLIDHLGNTVGNWCVSKSFDQLEGADNFSCSNITDMKISSTVRNRNIESSSTCSSSNSSALKSILINQSEGTAVDNVERLALARNEGGQNVGGKLTPLTELGEQIGVVLPPNVLERIETANANVNDSAGSDLSDTDHSEESCESAKMNKKVASTNTPLKNSSTFNAADVISLENSNALCKYKLKDVRVSLVKLENMIKLSKQTCNPLEAEKFYCAICKKYFTTKRGLRKHYVRIHEPKERSDEASEIAAEKMKSDDKSSSEALSKTIRMEEQENSGPAPIVGKHCYLCNGVFRNNLLVVSHLIAVHTDAGVLRCCLCNEPEKNSRRLRLHLYKHFNDHYTKNIPKSCVICTKELNIFSLSPHCSECKEQLKLMKSLNKRRTADVQESEAAPVAEKKYFSLRKRSLPSFLKDSIVSGIRTADNQPTKRDTKISTKIVKNFKCLACNRVFLERSRLKHHLLTAHVDVEYCKSETNQKVDSKIKNLNTKLKFPVGSKRTVKHKASSVCDKSREKKSCMRKRSKVFAISGKKEKCNRQRSFQNGTKSCYNSKCNVCGLNCCCRTCLQIHKKRYSSKGNNTCNTCGLTFAQKKLLAVHLKTAHNSKIIFNAKLKCQICTQGFYNKKFLRIHFAHFHNVKYLECKTCGIRFNSSRELNNHRQYYSEIGSCLCSSCGETFRCKYMLEYHNAQAHDYGESSSYKYPCNICHCAFLDKLLLQAHIGHFHNVKNHKSGKSMLIEDFGQAREKKLDDTAFRLVTENDALDSNVTNDPTFQTGVLDETVQPAHPPNEYKCTLCKLSFTDPFALLSHEWEYSNDGDYACDLCRRKFMTDIHLKNHKIKHYQRNAIRKYECYVCKEDFLRANDLVMHGLHLHGPEFISWRSSNAVGGHSSGESNHRVTQNRENICKKPPNGLFPNKKDSQNGTVLLFRKMANSSLSIELLRRHSNDDSYCCEFCPSNFNSASLLKDHTNKHTYHAYYTNLSKYLCLICKKKFRTNDILRAHVVHFHTSDQKQLILNKSGCSLLDKSMKFEVMNMSEKLPLEDTMTDPTTYSKGELITIGQPNITSPKKREQIFHPATDPNILAAHHVRPTGSAIRFKTETYTNSKCNDTVSKGDETLGNLNSSQQINAKLAASLEMESTSKAVKLFTIKVENPKEPREYTCIICIQTFGTVTQFAEHFSNVHVKDGAYVCALCEQRFVYMSDLKHHISRHEQDPTRYTCCDKKFSHITGLIHHKQLHPKQDEKNQNVPDVDLPPPDTVGSPKKSNGDKNANQPVTMCKCEICDAAFSDFRTLLKHWDACINKNCLQCNFCGARFKGERFLEVHKLSCNQNKQNLYTIQNRCSKTVQNNSSENIDIDNSLSVNLNPFKEQRRCYRPANKLLMQSKSSNIRQNTDDKKKCDPNEKQETNPPSNQAEVKSNQRIVQGTVLKKMLITNFAKKITLNINNKIRTCNLLTIRSNKKASSPIPHETDDEHYPSNLSNQNFNSIGDQSNVSNSVSPSNTQKQPTPSTNTVQNSTPTKLAIRSSIIIRSARVGPDQGSRKNNDEDTALLNLKPRSLNTANNQAHCGRIRYSNDQFKNTGDTSVTPSGSGETPRSNERHGNHKPPHLLELPSNRTNDSNPKSRTNNITEKQLLMLLQNSSSVSTSSIQDSDAQEATDNSTKSSNENTNSNDIASQLNINVCDHKKAPSSPNLVENSTHVASTLSHEDTTRDIDDPTEDSDSSTESEPRNFRCCWCSAWFSEREELNEHLEDHKIARQCTACGIVFSNDTALRGHSSEHERSICLRCGKLAVFRDAHAYYEGNQRYCSACKSLLPVPSGGSNQYSVSSERQVIKCGVCMEAFDSMSKLGAHFRAVHLSFVCLICQARFSTKYTLRNHLHTHDKQHTSETSKCNTCINNFAEEVNLEDDSGVNASVPVMVQPDPYA